MAVFRIEKTRDYQKALHDNPQLASGSPISRIWQKKRMQRQYAAAYRASRGAEGAKAAAQTTARSAKKGAEAAKKAGEFIARHKKVFLTTLRRIPGRTRRATPIRRATGSITIIISAP